MNYLIEAQHGINSHLIKPVQRICRYPLLMHELIKLTDPEHPFYRDLVEARYLCTGIRKKHRGFRTGRKAEPVGSDDLVG